MKSNSIQISDSSITLTHTISPNIDNINTKSGTCTNNMKTSILNNDKGESNDVKNNDYVPNASTYLGLNGSDDLSTISENSIRTEASEHLSSTSSNICDDQKSSLSSLSRILDEHCERGRSRHLSRVQCSF